MAWLLNDFGLLSVLLRALVLATEALAVGAVLFRTVVLRGADGAESAAWRRLLRIAAAVLLLAQLASIAVSAVELKATGSLAWSEILGAAFVRWDLLCAALAAVLFAMAGRASRILMLPALGIVACVVANSHAAAQLDHVALAVAATAAHHLGTAAWLGAMPFLLLALPRAGGAHPALAIAQRFSSMAVAGVALLLGGGIGMSLLYVGSWPAMYGTAYGVMLGVKILLFCVMLALGAGNFLLLRRLAKDPAPLLLRLSRFTEVELGIGFTVILAAASLTSQPPARDLMQDRVTVPELKARLAPAMPRLTSPPVASLTPAKTLDVAVADEARGDAPPPSSANDIAWSEYNHHWAGLIVLAAGALALLSRTRLRGTRWARHWPLIFLALAALIVLRADPENWPLGPDSFWGSFYDSEVLQHRLAALLVIGFAYFEWRVQNGRVSRPWMRLAFPAMCAGGAAILLTHSHALNNMKDEVLVQYSHCSIAVAGALAGWGRWLELRLPQDTSEDRTTVRWAGYLWPVFLMVAGLVLLNYREG